eukprot:SAG11_NODE_3418_length_2460_cov_2.180008_2_plen_91_part_00
MSDTEFRPVPLQLAAPSTSPTDVNPTKGSEEEEVVVGDYERARELLGMTNDQFEPSQLSACFQSKLREIKWQSPAELKLAHKEVTHTLLG